MAPLLWSRYPDPHARRVTVVLQEGVDGYTGTRDTYISKWQSTTNYGDRTWLAVRSHELMVGLLYFDLGTVPAGAELVEAHLRLNKIFQSNPNPMTVRAYRLLRPWDEMTATWVEARRGEPWAAPGGKPGADGDYYPSPADEKRVDAATDWLDLDVTSIVKAWVTYGAANYGIMLRGFAAGHVEYRFAAHEHKTVARHPQLILIYRMRRGE